MVRGKGIHISKFDENYTDAAIDKHDIAYVGIYAQVLSKIYPRIIDNIDSLSFHASIDIKYILEEELDEIFEKFYGLAQLHLAGEPNKFENNPIYKFMKHAIESFNAYMGLYNYPRINVLTRDIYMYSKFDKWTINSFKTDCLEDILQSDPNQQYAKNVFDWFLGNEIDDVGFMIDENALAAIFNLYG